MPRSQPSRLFPNLDNGLGTQIQNLVAFAQDLEPLDGLQNVVAEEDEA